MVSSRLLELVRCPECRSRITIHGEVATCEGCGRTYRMVSGDYLDLRPAVEYSEQTRYLDETLHADARHEHVSPPLLGSKIRNDMLREFLRPGSGDVIVDLGCGSGRTLLWNRDREAATVGIDIAPFFAEEARREVDLLLGDLRRLPFAEHTFTKAYSLDVLEHLSHDALGSMLGEASRVLAPGGVLFVYSHVRKNARIAVGLRWINAFARQLERLGLIDMRQERLRKSDHVNPLRDIPDLEKAAADAGFRIAKIRFYTPIVGGLVENVLMRIAERAMTRRRTRHLDANAGEADSEARAAKEVRASAKQRIASSRTIYAGLWVLSYAMKLDLLLFGRITSGPFFALLVKEKL